MLRKRCRAFSNSALALCEHGLRCFQPRFKRGRRLGRLDLHQFRNLRFSFQRLFEERGDEGLLG